MRHTAILFVVAAALIGCAQEHHRQEVAGLYTVLPPDQIDRSEVTTTVVPTPTNIPGVPSDVAGGYTTMTINRWEFQRSTGHRWPSNESIVASYSKPGAVTANPEYIHLVATINRLQALLANMSADDLSNAERAQILTCLRGAMEAFNRLSQMDTAFANAARIDATSPIWTKTEAALTDVDRATTAFTASSEVALLAGAAGAEPVSLGKAVAWLVDSHRRHLPSEVMPAVRQACVQLDRWENYHVDLLAGNTLTPDQRGALFIKIFRLRTSLLTFGANWSLNIHRTEDPEAARVVGPVQMAYP